MHYCHGGEDAIIGSVVAKELNLQPWMPSNDNLNDYVLTMSYYLLLHIGMSFFIVNSLSASESVQSECWLALF